MTRAESYHTARAEPETLATLVCSRTRGLGYCCLWAFFTRYKRTAMIATRLGVDRSTVKRWKARWRDGEFRCERCDNCIKKYLARLR